jgi:hypothetical protein
MAGSVGHERGQPTTLHAQAAAYVRTEVEQRFDEAGQIGCDVPRPLIER